MEIIGRHSRAKFRVGDRLDVLVVEVTPINGGILLAYVDGGGKRAKSNKPRNGKPGKSKKPAKGKGAKARKTRKARSRP